MVKEIGVAIHLPPEGGSILANFWMNINLIDEAFSYNTSGNGKCYYGATINGKTYPGERNWDERWELIKDCMDFTNKNVIELGCNMGILLAYLKKFSNIKNAIGVDQPDDLLIKTNKANTIKAANLLAKGFGVDISYLQIDMNAADYDKILGNNFDLAIAMSIYKWIEDKSKFLKYLSNFNQVLYEGHDSDEEEIERFANHGFNHKIIGMTQTGASYLPTNSRTIILFSKC